MNPKTKRALSPGRQRTLIGSSKNLLTYLNITQKKTKTAQHVSPACWVYTGLREKKTGENEMLYSVTHTISIDIPDDIALELAKEELDNVTPALYMRTSESRIKDLVYWRMCRALNEYDHGKREYLRKELGVPEERVLDEGNQWHCTKRLKKP